MMLRRWDFSRLDTSPGNIGGFLRKMDCMMFPPNILGASVAQVTGVGTSKVRHPQGQRHLAGPVMLLFATGRAHCPQTNPYKSVMVSVLDGASGR